MEAWRAGCREPGLLLDLTCSWHASRTCDLVVESKNRVQYIIARLLTMISKGVVYYGLSYFVFDPTTEPRTRRCCGIVPSSTGKKSPALEKVRIASGIQWPYDMECVLVRHTLMFRMLEESITEECVWELMLQ